MTLSWNDIKNTIKDGHIDYQELFDERQRKEIAFSITYAEQFAHGTDGHNAKLIIARLSEILELMADNITIEVTAE